MSYQIEHFSIAFLSNLGFTVIPYFLFAEYFLLTQIVIHGSIASVVLPASSVGLLQTTQSPKDAVHYPRFRPN